MGGVPPTLENKKTEPDLVHLFVNSLFFHRAQITHKKSSSVFLLLLFLYFMINVLELLGMDRLVSTSIQPIIPSITKIFPQEQKYFCDGRDDGLDTCTYKTVHSQ